MNLPEKINYLLINTPLTDPTTPYHSIPYLVSSASEAGFDNYFCLDANIESLNYLAQEDCVSQLLRDCKEALAHLELKSTLSNNEQILYRCAVKSIGLKHDSVLNAIAILKNSEDFYNYELYCQAVGILKRWMDILSVQGFPGQFNGFCLQTNFPLNLSRIKDLTNQAAIDKLMNPFLPYFNDSFAKCIKDRSWDFIGLSVNYIFQLPFAIWMSKYIRSLAPKAIISLGGTEISDIFKQLRDPNLMWDIFPHCDVVMVGEGETALVKILQSIQQQKPLPVNYPGILLRNEFVESKKPVVYEDVPNLPRTRYDVWDWNQYWSPEPVVLYSPTRGCYWNKCTFCDYGLNTDTPTSPSRERPVDKVVSELTEISKFSRTIYFAVDAMSPLYLKRLSKALIDANINIRWSAELRLEKSLQKELALDLRKAGCVCVSFGYESGSQRILDLINKGVKIKEVPQILHQLSEVNIGTQIMGFTGFPGETLEEALETYHFLERNRSGWTLAGIGSFSLTPGAIVSKQPAAFGINEINSYIEDDIVRSLTWKCQDTLENEDNKRNEHLYNASESLNLLKGDRPFVGGIDSSHSILYFAKFGKNMIPSSVCVEFKTEKLLEKAYYHTSHQNADDFTRFIDVYQHCHSQYPDKHIGFDEINKWLSGYPERQIPINYSGEAVLTIYPNGEFFRNSIGHHSIKNILQREGLLIASN
jgi:anaerobic magnesium-protoporphyrin IX monomethyl ester cyclase